MTPTLPRVSARIWRKIPVHRDDVMLKTNRISGRKQKVNKHTILPPFLVVNPFPDALLDTNTEHLKAPYYAHHQYNTLGLVEAQVIRDWWYTHRLHMIHTWSTSGRTLHDLGATTSRMGMGMGVRVVEVVRVGVVSSSMGVAVSSMRMAMSSMRMAMTYVHIINMRERERAANYSEHLQTTRV